MVSTVLARRIFFIFIICCFFFAFVQRAESAKLVRSRRSGNILRSLFNAMTHEIANLFSKVAVIFVRELAYSCCWILIVAIDFTGLDFS